MTDKNASPAVQSIDKSIADLRESLNMATESVALATPGSDDERHGRVIVRMRDASLSALLRARKDVIAAEKFASRSW